MRRSFTVTPALTGHAKHVGTTLLLLTNGGALTSHGYLDGSGLEVFV